MRIVRRGISTTVVVAVVVVIVVVAAAGAIYFANPFGSSAPPSIIIFSADAYVAESSYLGSGFANSSGATFVTPTSAGSLALAQQIKAGATVSVFISVSKAAVTTADLGSRGAGWAIAFAGDQMVLAYSNTSSHSSQVDSVLSAFSTASASNATKDWNAFFTDVASGNVKVGISNPNADPAGYRGWLVLEAAGATYAGGNSSYFSKMLLANHGNVTGSSAATLVAPLQAGNIDFLFTYKSAAVSHGLSYLTLPRQVNLGDPKLGSYYSKFTYKITSGVQKGAAIVLFVTVPNNSTATTQALNFVTYLVGHVSSMSTYGLAVMSPPKLYNDSSVPTQIGQLATSGSVALGGAL